jgi:hypothetical protein
MTRGSTPHGTGTIDRCTVLLVALVALVGLNGCAQASGHPSATAGPTPPLAPTPTPLPIAAVVAHPAGWTTATSPNWSGYTFPRGGITGVRAQWREPQVSGQPGAQVAFWIGLGGWASTSGNLVRVGTQARVGANGDADHGVWYETQPPAHARFPGMNLGAGDQVFASIELQQARPQLWHLLVIDLTNQQTLDVSFTFSSMQAYADVMAEDPLTSTTTGSPYAPLASFSPFSFSNLQIRYGSTWVSAAAVRALQVTMAQQGHVLVVPGPLSNGDVTLQHA